MAAKKELKNNNMKPIYKYGLIILAIFICLWLYISFAQAYTTQVVFSGKEELILPLKGIVSIDEELLTTDKKSFCVMNYSDGTKVLAKVHVASLYADNVDDAKTKSIKELNERINNLDISIKNMSGEIGNADSNKAILLSKMKKVSYHAEKGNFDSILKESGDIEGFIFGSSDMSPENQLAALVQKRDALEETIKGQKTPYYSKSSGVLYSHTDGFETIHSKNILQSVTPNSFENLWNAKPVDYNKANGEYVFGKIVNNFEVVIYAPVNKVDVSDIELNQYLSIKAADAGSGNITCQVVYMSEESGGKVVIGLKVTRNIDKFIKDRKIHFSLIKNNYKGLRLEKSAIMRDAEGTFVYVVNDGMVRRKSVEIEFEKNDFVIVKEDNTNPKNILLYDTVITKARNIKEGDIVGFKN